MSALAEVAADEAGPVTEEQWAKHRRAAMQSLPPELAEKELPDILLAYQKERLESVSHHALVADEKSRRIGATWGIGAQAVLTSGAQKSAGGMDTLYIGYNLDMAREFIDACAMWAKSFVPAASAVQEFLFEEQDENGADRSIKAFRIAFASGFEIVALSSRPRSLRGKQGFVILDEFAFHDEPEELLKAAMALLIWGGRVLVISTHNGADNAFAALIEEIRSGKRAGHVVRTTFDEALRQGLYQRICLVTRKEWSPEAEARWRSEIRSFYGSDAAEELDCVPALGAGVYISGALVESCMDGQTKVIRLRCPDDFALKPDGYRETWVGDWLEENLKPILDDLDENLRHSYGFDFGRTGHLSVLLPLAEGKDLVRRAPFILEMRNVPFAQQEQVLHYIVPRLPRFAHGKHDARGNGQYLAERAQQKFGALHVEAVMLTQPWYLDNAPKLRARFEDRTIELPLDADVKGDFRLLKMVRGVPKVPDNEETQGSDGGKRHGDAVVAAILANAAADEDVAEYGYRPAVPAGQSEGRMRDRPEDDAAAGVKTNWWRSPLGSFLRGGL